MKVKVSIQHQYSQTIEVEIEESVLEDTVVIHEIIVENELKSSQAKKDWIGTFVNRIDNGDEVYRVD